MGFSMARKRGARSENSGMIIDSSSHRFLILLLSLLLFWCSSTLIWNVFFRVCISSRKLDEIPAGNVPYTVNLDSFPLTKVENLNAINISESIRTRNKEEDDYVVALKDVESQMKILREGTDVINRSTSNCEEKGIFVYDLPEKFNKDIENQCEDMVPWQNFCDFFSNDAMGNPIEKMGKGWYNTHQYSLEPIFHSRILNHPCRVYKEEEAKLFYVAFYGGLSILRWHFKDVNVSVKDSPGTELIKWLELQKSWVKKSGKDHIFVLGKISWDFRRKGNDSWGSNFLELSQMQNPLKLLIERHPWRLNDIGVPHPSNFHPHSDEDIIAWQSKISENPRKNLVSFAGAARPDSPHSIRNILIDQCTYNFKDCKFRDCNNSMCSEPESVMELFINSEFCLQPPGDSPTRKSVFDSLISGCIPVIFDPFTTYYQYPWHLPEDHKKYSVFIDKEKVRELNVDVIEKLKTISVNERDEMRKYIIYELMPGLVYGDPTSKFNKFEDAFEISMKNILHLVSKSAE